MNEEKSTEEEKETNLEKDKEVEKFSSDKKEEEEEDSDDDDDDDDDDDSDDSDDESEDESENEDKADAEMKKCHNPPNSEKSLGNEKLASEYEQFMKMVSNDSASKSLKIPPTSSNYNEFNLDSELVKQTNCKYVNQSSIVDESQKLLVKEKNPKMNEEKILSDSEKDKGEKINKNISEKEEKTLITVEKGEKNLSVINKSGKKVSTIEKEKKTLSDGEKVSEEMDNVARDETVIKPIQESSEKTNRTKTKDKINESQDSDSRSIPSDWENVRIKVEQLSDENVETKKIKKKKKQKKRSYSTSSESSSSSSSSESEEKTTTKKRRKKKVVQSSSDSDSSDSSSSESTSSDDTRKKKRKRIKKKKRVKKSTKKSKKKRSRKRADSTSSDSDDARKKKRLKKKKLRKKLAEVKEETSRKRKRKSSTRSLSSDKNLKRLHVEKTENDGKRKKKRRFDKLKRTKLSSDLEKRILAEALSPDSVLLKECDTGKEQNLIQEQARKQKKKKRDISEDRLSEWEKESILMTRQIEGSLEHELTSDDSSEKEVILKNAEKEKRDAKKREERKLKKREEIRIREEKEAIKREEARKKEENNKREESKNKEEETKVAKEEMEETLGKNVVVPVKEIETIVTEIKEKPEQVGKKETEILSEWEKESQRITNVLKLIDSEPLNVSSLTHLDVETRKRDILADEWEVDSLESIRDAKARKKSSTRHEKVKYDMKTDTYISVEREVSRDNKKKQERLSAIRIWEEEQEEGDREEMLLIEEKSKLQNWDIEDEFTRNDSYVSVEINTDDLLQNNLKDETNKSEKIVLMDAERDENVKKNDGIDKRRRKSRWDVGNQVEDKDDINMTPVMWEEECTDWQKTSGTESALLHLAKVKEQISPILEALPEKIKLENFHITVSPDVFQKKLQKMGLAEDWLANDPLEKKTFVCKKETEKTETETTAKLKSIVELQDQEMKNVHLYSPSSPALSQKTEVSF